MSATILWAAVHGHLISTGVPAHTVEILRRAFGEFPLQLRFEPHAATLRGIGAADQENEAWNEILTALERHGEIRVWAEW